MGNVIVDLTPKVLHEGVYRLYEKADGTLHLVYKPEGQDDERHMELPGNLVRLAQAAAEGHMSPIEMMKAAAGLMGGMPNGG